MKVDKKEEGQLLNIISYAIKQTFFYCQGQFKQKWTKHIDCENESHLKRQQLRIMTDLYRKGMEGLANSDEMRLDLVCHYLLEMQGEVDSYHPQQYNENNALKDVKTVKLNSGYCTARQLNKLVQRSNSQLRNASIIGIKCGVVSVHKFVHHYLTKCSSFEPATQKEGCIEQRNAEQLKRAYYEKRYGKHDFGLKKKRESKLKLPEDLDLSLQKKQDKKKDEKQQKNEEIKRRQLNLIEQNETIKKAKQQQVNEQQVKKKQKRNKNKSKVKDSKKNMKKSKNESIEALNEIEQVDRNQQISNRKMDKKVQIKNNEKQMNLINKKGSVQSAIEQKQKHFQNGQNSQKISQKCKEQTKMNSVLNKIRKIQSNTQKDVCQNYQVICQEDQQSIIQSLSISNQTFTKQKSNTFDNSLRGSKVEQGVPQNDKNLQKKKHKPKISFKNAVPTNNTTLDSFVKKK